MRVPVSWLAEYVDLPAGSSARELADALVRVGLEVETVEPVGAGLAGDLVVGRVLESVDEAQSNGKTIRWCTVDVGTGEPRGIVCGAHNFVAGDAVVVALPGTVLPGGFAIAARKTYGHVSDGMICSVRELGLGDEHTGILVLSEADLAGAVPGDDARPVLGLPDVVLDIAVTPDRGYCLSVRGVARELSAALGLPFRDPARRSVPVGDDAGWPVRVEDPTGCDRFVARTVVGVDPAARAPFWLRRRLVLAGMRPVSLAVDVTNYVMLELGQPIHGYDRARLDGPIVVRRAAADEELETLDGAAHALDPDDLLIADGSGPIGVAGVMGGASTEIAAGTTEIVVEAAHFDPVAVARSSRRHRLSTEASRRFERGVDDALAPVAADLVVELLCRLGGGRADAGVTDLDLRAPRSPIELDVDLPARLVGVELGETEVRVQLSAVGCELDPSGPGRPGWVTVLPPTWRPDLVQPVDLVEEVARLHGYDTIPSVLPLVVPGHHQGLPFADSLAVSRALAGSGYVEVRSYPFGSVATLDALGLPADDERRRAVRLANPLSDEEPLLRTTLLPGLLATARRNVGRGMPDLALFESGRVFRPAADAPPAPRLPVDRRPGEAELDALDAALPDQPVQVALVLTGAREARGWWGAGRAATWADAVEAARVVAGALDVDVRVRAADLAPWHPGRCAEIVAGDPGSEEIAGYAGELHPRVCVALGLPERTCAAELVLPVLARHSTPLESAPQISAYPVATQDVALVVESSQPAADVQAALSAGAGPLLESIRLFDVYEGDQVGAGHKSLAYALRFRATDRTLTAEEAAAARDAAVAEAGRRTGAVLRG
jgi:phenylalanyl-tRNA synthetase beta chain